MPSPIAWLDASTEDHRRMREIVKLFSQQESRDELGIGQIRDALSDSLFPGTSTLHTRARYLLLVPWCLRYAANHARDAASIMDRVDKTERALIGGTVAEEEANAYASDVLIPRSFDDRLPLTRDIAAVQALAEELGIAPSIVLGRAQRQTTDYAWGHSLRHKLDFAASVEE